MDHPTLGEKRPACPALNALANTGHHIVTWRLKAGTVEPQPGVR
jgi:hypothetical protein